jgi:hypothetical protein
MIAAALRRDSRLASGAIRTLADAVSAMILLVANATV